MQAQDDSVLHQTMVEAVEVSQAMKWWAYFKDKTNTICSVDSEASNLSNLKHGVLIRMGKTSGDLKGDFCS